MAELEAVKVTRPIYRTHGVAGGSSATLRHCFVSVINMYIFGGTKGKHGENKIQQSGRGAEV